MSNLTNVPDAPSPDAQALSELMDGEASSGSAGSACASWAERDDARADWHAYHVIGDVLRSEELGCAAQDEAFLRRLRERLVREPVVLAPAPLAAAAEAAPRHRWVGGFGVAAGLLVVATAALVLKDPVSRPAALGISEVAAVAPASVVPVAASAVAVEATVEPVQVVNGSVMRSASLDRYLEAHKQYSGTSALGPSPGFLRSATYETPSR